MVGMTPPKVIGPDGKINPAYIGGSNPASSPRWTP